MSPINGFVDRKAQFAFVAVSIFHIGSPYATQSALVAVPKLQIVFFAMTMANVAIILGQHALLAVFTATVLTHWGW